MMSNYQSYWRRFFLFSIVLSIVPLLYALIGFLSSSTLHYFVSEEGKKLEVLRFESEAFTEQESLLSRVEDLHRTSGELESVRALFTESASDPTAAVSMENALAFLAELSSEEEANEGSDLTSGSSSGILKEDPTLPSYMRNPLNRILFYAEGDLLVERSFSLRSFDAVRSHCLFPLLAFLFFSLGYCSPEGHPFRECMTWSKFWRFFSRRLLAKFAALRSLLNSRASMFCPVSFLTRTFPDPILLEERSVRILR